MVRKAENAVDRWVLAVCVDEQHRHAGLAQCNGSVDSREGPTFLIIGRSDEYRTDLTVASQHCRGETAELVGTVGLGSHGGDDRRVVFGDAGDLSDDRTTQVGLDLVEVANPAVDTVDQHGDSGTSKRTGHQGQRDSEEAVDTGGDSFGDGGITNHRTRRHVDGLQPGDLSLDLVDLTFVLGQVGLGDDLRRRTVGRFIDFGNRTISLGLHGLELCRLVADQSVSALGCRYEFEVAVLGGCGCHTGLCERWCFGFKLDLKELVVVAGSHGQRILEVFSGPALGQSLFIEGNDGLVRYGRRARDSGFGLFVHHVSVVVSLDAIDGHRRQQDGRLGHIGCPLGGEKQEHECSESERGGGNNPPAPTQNRAVVPEFQFFFLVCDSHD